MVLIRSTRRGLVNITNNSSKVNLLKLFHSSSSECNNDNTENNKSSSSPNRLCLNYNMPRVLVPSPFELIRVRLSTQLNMWRLDRSFDYAEFCKGSLQAAIAVSNKVARGEFDEKLGDLVSASALKEVERNWTKLTAEQKSMIGMRDNDVRLQVGYNFELVQEERTFARIGQLFYLMPDFTTLIEKYGDSNSRDSLLNFRASMDARKKLEESMIICDYRFVKEYTKDAESDWFISELNHWRFKDFEEEG